MRMNKFSRSIDIFDAVIFDCDGVLVDSEVLSIAGEREALTMFGLNYSPAEYVARFVGLHDAAFFSQLREDYFITFKRDAPSNFEAEILEGRARQRHKLVAIAGAADALSHARTRIGCLAVASSSRTTFLDSKLKRTALYDLAAPHIYSADLVAEGKPAPDIFLYAASSAGVDPQRCLVLEDSENGVKAGVAAGMTVWGFLGGGHVFDGHGVRLKAAGAAALVDDFAQFIAMLDAP